LFAAVIEAVTIPVIAGTGTYDTRHSVHLTKQAEALGAAGILAVSPYYNRPSQPDRCPHASDRRTAICLSYAFIRVAARSARRLAGAVPRPNIVAWKDAAANPGETAALISSLPEG
jgi:4-hydroxy-tetrahydrodipicolinate synthase